MRRSLLAACAFTATAWAAGDGIVGLATGVTFHVARDRAAWLSVAPERFAGEIAGALLHAWTTGAWAACAVVAGCCLGLSARNRAAPAILALSGLVACVAVHWLVVATIGEAHALRERLLGDESLRASFDAAHARSVRWFGLETALVAGVAIASLVALVRRPRDTISAASALAPAA